MKTLAELAEIREKNKNKIALRHGLNNIRIVVGMGTCGIAAGARDVLGAFVDEINGTDLIETVTVTQSGCMGELRKRACRSDHHARKGNSHIRSYERGQG